MIVIDLLASDLVPVTPGPVHVVSQPYSIAYYLRRHFHVHALHSVLRMVASDIEGYSERRSRHVLRGSESRGECQPRMAAHSTTICFCASLSFYLYLHRAGLILPKAAARLILTSNIAGKHPRYGPRRSHGRHGRSRYRGRCHGSSLDALSRRDRRILYDLLLRHRRRAQPPIGANIVPFFR